MRVKKKKKNNYDPQVMLKIWRHSPGDYFCVSTKESTGRRKWRDKLFKRSQMGRALTYAQSLPDHDVYMGTHGYSASRRHKSVSVDPALLYADLDEVDPRTLELRPTIALESSPGRYVGYWFTDEPASESLNQRMTYFCEADASGWDRTQVLRVPGTYNHKPDYDLPRVKVLWTDGPRYEVARLEKVLPPMVTDEGKEAGGDALKIYKQYEKYIPRPLRREFINPKVQQGKRSEVLWKLLNACLEAGMTEDEAFTVCWHNPWNKHADRRSGGERQMRNELEKALGRHVGGSKKGVPKKKKKIIRKKRQIPEVDPSDHGGGFMVHTMDKVEIEQVDWIVDRMIARQQTTICEGDPGVGKSYLLMWMMIHICDGILLPWLDPKRDKPFKGKVLYCDMENSAGAITKTRLIDNGLKNTMDYGQLTAMFSVDDPDTFEMFEKTIITFKPDVVVIDPVNLYIGNADTYRASETQQALQHLKSLSEEYNFALVIVRHLNKSSGAGKALYAGNGSIAFAGVARVIMTVGWHPDEADTRVVACTKNNLSGFFGSFGYTIAGLPDTLERRDRSLLTYEGHMSYSSDEILSTTNQKEEGTAAIAADLIREHLDAGETEINYHRLLQKADGHSISEKSILKAAADLGLKKLSRGRGKARTTLLVQPK